MDKLQRHTTLKPPNKDQDFYYNSPKYNPIEIYTLN